MKKRELCPELLRTLLSYDAKTGVLTWKRRDASICKSKRAASIFNELYAGKEALTAVTSLGYRKGGIFRTSYLAHRVIWALVHGEWPEAGVDHINGDPSDNRLVNLRAASVAQNVWNSRIRTSNTSGFKGVIWFKPKQRWRAEITVLGRQVHLGYFRTPEAAHEAYCAASARLHGEYGRTH